MEKPATTPQAENNDELGLDELDEAAGGAVRDDDGMDVNGCRELLLMTGVFPLFAE